MDMNGNKMSGRTLNGKEVFGRETTGDKVMLPRARQVELTDLGKKKFPFGWLLPVAALSFFVGHFWSYLPVVHGIVSLFVFSKYLAGLSGTHFLL
jgi:hypothetical protein